MRFDRSYNLHGLVGLRVQSDTSFVDDYFRAEYGPSAGAVSNQLPRVTIRLTESRLPRRPDASYKLKIHKGLSRWYYRVRFSPEMILIEATGNRMAIPMVHHMLVHGGLRYLCSERGVLLLHAAALAFDGRSLIFAGSGGAGKTTVSSIVLDQGTAVWELQADDYVFVSTAGATYSYPSRAHLYANFLKGVPSASSKLSSSQRAHLAVFGAVRRLSGERIKWPLRVAPSALWPDRRTANRAQLQTLLLLESSSTGDLAIEPVGESADLTDQLMQVNRYEARHTIDLIGGSQAPSDFPDRWQRRERSILDQALRGASAFRLTLPPVASIDRSELVDLMQQVVTVENG